ncbi:MAG: sigma factor-like helix-turn-helix DNA-binding protein [Candidatus Bathyarchaeota archaeon]|nr:sigma factor-like helix-turn-helix DNA-binding protein [Candidatus Bathyarchaeota archaeon]
MDILTKEDVQLYKTVIHNRLKRLDRKYFEMLKNRETPDYKTFVRVYLANKEALSEREQSILDLRYGVHEEAMTLKKISKVIGVSPERIRQVGTLAERKLSSYL